MAQPQRRFYFRLAERLGMTVRELLSRTTSAELTEWMAFTAIENGYTPKASVETQLMRIFGGPKNGG